MKTYAIIDKGPDGTWSYLVWRYSSRAAAEAALPHWTAQYPRSQFVVI